MRRGWEVVRVWEEPLACEAGLEGGTAGGGLEFFMSAETVAAVQMENVPKQKKPFRS